MLRGARVGDLRTVQLPGGAKEWEVVEIAYPEPSEPVTGGPVNGGPVNSAVE
jgi:hypothetical protein